MSWRKKNKKNQTTKVKLKNSKFKPKKASHHKKRKRKLLACNGNKKQDNADNKTQEHNNDNGINVKQTKLMVRRYEEFHETFLDYDKILKFLEKTQKCYPSLVDLVKIGNSTNGKPIYMVLITASIGNSNNPKMAIFIEAGLNGENAFAVSNTLYMIEHLTKNPNFVKIMDYFIVPCCNPDAYDAFIKSKQKDTNTKSRNKCDLGNKTSKSNISQGSTGKIRSNSPKNDKKVSKNSRCTSPSENIIFAKKFRSNGSSEEEESKNYYCIDSHITDDMKKSGSRSSICKTGQRKDSCSKTAAKNNNRKEKNKNPSQTKRSNAQNKSDTEEKNHQSSVGVDLILNFPVVLGLNDMQRIPNDLFGEKIRQWKEHYINNSPETRALINAIYRFQFAIKLLISLQEGGEAVCYPYGFCTASGEETDDLKVVAKKGKSAITARNFEYGSLYDIQGLSYGNLMDFLKVDKTSIKYMYVIKVHKKTPRYNEKDELKQLMRYGCEIMECIKRMSCSVYKMYTDMTGNKRVETESTKPSLEKRSNF